MNIPVPAWKVAYLRLTRNLIKGRDASNLTQDTVAARLGISRRTFQRYEGFESHCDVPTLFKWADIVGVEIASNLTLFETGEAA